MLLDICIDFFRLVDELIVEHWDNVEVVPPENEWVNSGEILKLKTNAHIILKLLLSVT